MQAQWRIYIYIYIYICVLYIISIYVCVRYLYLYYVFMKRPPSKTHAINFHHVSYRIEWQCIRRCFAVVGPPPPPPPQRPCCYLHTRLSRHCLRAARACDAGEDAPPPPPSRLPRAVFCRLSTRLTGWLALDHLNPIVLGRYALREEFIVSPISASCSFSN